MYLWSSIFYTCYLHTLYRYRIQDSFSFICDASKLGENCGSVTPFTTLDLQASFENPFQNVSLVGDVTRDILYAAYGSQCGIFSFQLSTGNPIGWVTAWNMTDTNGTVTATPFCGYSGKFLSLLYLRLCQTPFVYAYMHLQMQSRNAHTYVYISYMWYPSISLPQTWHLYNMYTYGLNKRKGELC